MSNTDVHRSGGFVCIGVVDENTFKTVGQDEMAMRSGFGRWENEGDGGRTGVVRGSGGVGHAAWAEERNEGDREDDGKKGDDE